MPTGSLPLPPDLVAAVGDFKTELKSIEKQLREIDRASSKAIKKGELIDQGEIDRAGYLKRRQGELTAAIGEQDRQRAFDKRVEKWAARKASAGRMDTGDVRDLRDIIDLARGQVSVRNVAGATELATKIRRAGLKGVTDLAKQAPAAAMRMLGLGELGVVGLPFAWAALGYDQLQDAFALSKEIQPKVKATQANINRAVKDKYSRAVFADAIAIAAGQSARDNAEGFDEIIKNEVEGQKRLSEQLVRVADPSNVAAVLRHNFGLVRPSTVEGVKGALLDLANNGRLDEALTLAEARKGGLSAFADEQAHYFAEHPQQSAAFHDQSRLSARLEREKAEHGVRGW